MVKKKKIPNYSLKLKKIIWLEKIRAKFKKGKKKLKLYLNEICKKKKLINLKKKKNYCLGPN